MDRALARLVVLRALSSASCGDRSHVCPTWRGNQRLRSRAAPGIAPPKHGQATTSRSRRAKALLVATLMLFIQEASAKLSSGGGTLGPTITNESTTRMPNRWHLSPAGARSRRVRDLTRTTSNVDDNCTDRTLHRNILLLQFPNAECSFCLVPA